MNWAASVSLNNSPREEDYYEQPHISYSSILPYSYGSISDGALTYSNISIRIPQSIPENKHLLKFASSHNDIDEYGDEEPTEDEDEHEMQNMAGRFGDQRPFYSSPAMLKSSFNYNFIQEATQDPHERNFHLSKLPSVPREKQPLLSTTSNKQPFRSLEQDPEEASRVAKWEKHLEKFKKNSENQNIGEKITIKEIPGEIKVAPSNNSYWIRERERLRAIRGLARTRGLEVSRGKVHSLFRGSRDHPTASKWKILIVGCSVPLVIVIGILLCVYVFHWSPASLATQVNGNLRTPLQQQQIQQTRINEAEAAHDALAPWLPHNLRTNKNK